MKCGLFVISSLLALSAVQGAVTSSPVERVVNLLKDLSEKLVNDEKAEQKVYDKYACWCETTSSRKASAINQGTADMRTLGQTILKLKGSIATLTAEIEELNAGIKKNKEDQAEATSIRGKENADYTAETTETKEALAALEKAIDVLVKGTTLVQEQTHATAAVKRVVDSMPMSANFNNEQVALLSEFLSSAGTAKYAPQSNTVQGMLKDMYETFASNLESATATEAKQNRDFEDFIAVKTAEMKEDEALVAKKTGEKAEAESRLADTQSMYDDTQAQKEADIEFFDQTKAACETKSEEWTLRSKLREEELSGIKEALEILTSDEARELFASAIKPGQEVGAGSTGKSSGMDIKGSISFLQVDTDTNQPKERAYNALKRVSSRNHSLRLAALAIRVRSAKAGHFDKVIAEIDGVIADLKAEGAADIAKRDQCKDEYKNTASVIKETKWLIEKNDAKIAKLEGLIQLRTEQKMKTIEDIKELQAQMAQMKADREAENEAFLFAKKEDMMAISLLTAAREALSKFYVKNKVEMGPVQGSVKLLQQPEFAVSEDQAPDASFSGKGARKNESKGIVSILTMIIEDLDDEIKNGMKAEEDAQLEYEEMKAAGLKLLEELTTKKLSLTEAISKRQGEKTDETEDKRINTGDLEDEEKYLADITPDCDWIIGAFEKRATARAAEMEGLTGAKEFLAGAKAPSLLQAKHAFDDNTLSNLKFLGLRK